jgi:hypothetical protein
MAWYRWLVLPARAVYSYARYRLAQGRAAPESRWWCPRIGDPVSDCFGRYGTVARVDIFSGMASVLYRDPSRFEEISWMNCLSPDLR